MYLNPTGTENATELPISQDAWMLLRFDNHELIRIHKAGHERSWHNSGKEELQLLVIKTKSNP